MFEGLKSVTLPHAYSSLSRQFDPFRLDIRERKNISDRGLLEFYSFDQTELHTAYNTTFSGNAAQQFVDYVLTSERDVAEDLYAKSIPIVQSSGTGKSRMLTEVRLRVL
jgi:hypothetical protein